MIYSVGSIFLDHIIKINSGNVPVKPIPLNAVTIRDRFRKEIGLVNYL